MSLSSPTWKVVLGYAGMGALLGFVTGGVLGFALDMPPEVAARIAVRLGEYLGLGGAVVGYLVDRRRRW